MKTIKTIKTISILSIGLSLCALSTNDVNASWRTRAANLVKEKAIKGEIAPEVAAKSLTINDSSQLADSRFVAVVQKQIANPDSPTTHDSILQVAPTLADKLIPEYIRKAFTTLMDLNHTDMINLLTRFADQDAIDANFTQAFNELGLTKRVALQTVEQWVRDFGMKLFGPAGKYKGATDQQNQLAAMTEMLKVVTEDLNHIHDNALLTAIYVEAKAEGMQFDLQKALQKALGPIQFDGTDISAQVAELVIKGSPIATATKNHKINLLTDKYVVKFGLSKAVSKQVATDVIDGTRNLKGALTARVAVATVDGSDIKADVINLLLAGQHKLDEAVKEQSIRLRTAKFKDYGFDQGDAVKFANHMTTKNKTHKQTLTEEYKQFTRHTKENVAARVIDLLMAGQKIQNAAKQADTEVYKRAFAKYSLPGGKDQAAAEFLANDTSDHGAKNSAFVWALKHVLDTVIFERSDIKDRVAEEIVKSGAKYNDVLLIVKVRVLSAQFEGCGLDKASSQRVAKAVVQDGKDKKAALVEYLKKSPHLKTSTPKYDAIAGDVADNIIAGQNIIKAVYAAKIGVEKTWFTSIRNLGLSQSEINTAAEATVNDKGHSRTAGLAVALKTTYGKAGFSSADLNGFSKEIVENGKTKKAALTDFLTGSDHLKTASGKYDGIANAVADQIIAGKDIKTAVYAAKVGVEKDWFDTKAALGLDPKEINAAAEATVNDAHHSRVNGLAAAFADTFGPHGLTPAESLSVAKDVIDGKTKKVALSDFLKGSKHIPNAGKYSNISDAVADEILAGKKIGVAVKNAQVGVEKTWFTSKAGLGLNPTQIVKAAEATVNDKTNSRAFGLAVVIKKVEREGQDLTNQIALEMLNGAASNFDTASKVVLKKFWAEDEEGLKARVKLSAGDYVRLAEDYVDDAEKDENLKVHLANILGSITRVGNPKELKRDVAAAMLGQKLTQAEATKIVFIKDIEAEIIDSHAHLKAQAKSFAEAMYEDGKNLEAVLKAFIADDTRFGKKPDSGQADEIFLAVFNDAKSLSEAFNKVFLGEIGGFVKTKYTGLDADDIQQVAQAVQRDSSADAVDAKIQRAAEIHLRGKYQAKFKWADHIHSFLTHLGTGESVEDALRNSALEKARKMLSKILGGDNKIRKEEFEDFARVYCSLAGDYSNASVEEQFKVYLLKMCRVTKDLEEFYGWVKGGGFVNHRTPGLYDGCDADATLNDYFKFAQNWKAEQAAAKEEEARKAAQAKLDEEERLRREAAARAPKYRARVIAKDGPRGIYCCFHNKVDPTAPDLDFVLGAYIWFHPDKVNFHVNEGDLIRFCSARPRRKFQDIPQGLKKKLTEQYTKKVINFTAIENEDCSVAFKMYQDKVEIVKFHELARQSAKAEGRKADEEAAIRFRDAAQLEADTALTKVKFRFRYNYSTPLIEMNREQIKAKFHMDFTPEEFFPVKGVGGAACYKMKQDTDNLGKPYGAKYYVDIDNNRTYDSSRRVRLFTDRIKRATLETYTLGKGTSYSPAKIPVHISPEAFEDI